MSIINICGDIKKKIQKNDICCDSNLENIFITLNRLDKIIQQNEQKCNYIHNEINNFVSKDELNNALDDIKQTFNLIIDNFSNNKKN